MAALKVGSVKVVLKKGYSIRLGCRMEHAVQLECATFSKIKDDSIFFITLKLQRTLKPLPSSDVDASTLNLMYVLFMRTRAACVRPSNRGDTGTVPCIPAGVL